MRETSYTDDDGRLWMVLLPDGESDDYADRGIPLGPIDIRDYAEEHDWPRAFEVRLHNELFHRRIFPTASERELRARAPDFVSAIMAAAKIDAATIIRLSADTAILSLDGENDSAS